MQTSQFVEDAMNAHQDTVLRVACSILNSLATADDVTQDVFIKLYRYDGTFESEAHLRHWLIAVARTTALDYYRRNKASPVDYVDPTCPGALEKLLLDQTQLSDSNLPVTSDDYLWRHVAKLSHRERDLVYLRYAEQLPVGEVAKIVGRPYPAVCSALFRARQKLRKMIEDEKKQREEDSHGSDQEGSL